MYFFVILLCKITTTNRHNVKIKNVCNNNLKKLINKNNNDDCNKKNQIKNKKCILIKKAFEFLYCFIRNWW